MMKSIFGFAKGRISTVKVHHGFFLKVVVGDMGLFVELPFPSFLKIWFRYDLLSVGREGFEKRRRRILS